MPTLLKPTIATISAPTYSRYTMKRPYRRAPKNNNTIPRMYYTTRYLTSVSTSRIVGATSSGLDLQSVLP